LIRQLDLCVSTVQARFDRLEALLGMHPGPSPSDLLETLVDYFIMENVPIPTVDGEDFPAVLCRREPTIASHILNGHQFRAAILQ
jgi:hypothetical protein